MFADTKWAQDIAVLDGNSAEFRDPTLDLRNVSKDESNLPVISLIFGGTISQL